jgi:uncharacterized protein YeaO (DUF488 family)
MYDIQIKRIYDPVEDSDGYRVLVDRLWPRGISKENAKIDDWPKSVTPTSELRKAYHQDMSQTEAFESSYNAELDANPDFPLFARRVYEKLSACNVTLITAAKNMVFNHATVLKSRIESYGSI